MAAALLACLAESGACLFRFVIQAGAPSRLDVILAAWNVSLICLAGLALMFMLFDRAFRSR